MVGAAPAAPIAHPNPQPRSCGAFFNPALHVPFAPNYHGAFLLRQSAKNTAPAPLVRTQGTLFATLDAASMVLYF